MYRSLLVPLDGSTFAEHALPCALSIARQAGATLQVVLVHVPYALMYVDSMSPAAHDVESRRLAEERAYLAAVVERLSAVWTVPVTSALLEGPNVAEALNNHVAAIRIDLVVMTTHGRGPLTRFWLGSVADELVRRATVPILLVRPQEAAPDLASAPTLQHLLIPLDGSELAEQVLEPAVALGTLMHARYTLLQVVPSRMLTGLASMGYAEINVLDEPPLEARRTEAHAYLERVAERLRGQALPVQTSVVVADQPAVAILDEAHAQGIQLIALATHGRRGPARLLLGSVADKVVRGASTPVLVYRPRSQ